MRSVKLLGTEGGFTLVEAMVAAALFSVAIVGMIDLMQRQGAAVGGLQNQINLRQILNSAEGVWAANNNNFPPAAAAPAGGGAASAQGLTYVGCFTSSGMATSNSISPMAFVAVDLAGANPATQLSGACDCNYVTPPALQTINSLANAEVHFVRTIKATPAANTVSVYVILLPPVAAGVNPCNPGPPSTYAVGAPGTRNWSSANYVSAPTKIVWDTFDITYPP